MTVGTMVIEGWITVTEKRMTVICMMNRCFRRDEYSDRR